nr:glutathione binding-like protein [Yersinia pestis]
MHRKLKRHVNSYVKSYCPSRQSLTETPFFMSEEFSLVDCYLAPLLWRLPVLGIEFTGAGSKELKGYMTRVFERDAFLASLTEAEREMHLKTRS